MQWNTSAAVKNELVTHAVILCSRWVDGNKRWGYGLLRIYLAFRKHEITASLDKRYEFLIANIVLEISPPDVPFYAIAKAGQSLKQWLQLSNKD